MRATLLLAPLAALAAAVPAGAAGGPAPTPPPVCVAVVVSAVTGPSAGCTTLGRPPAVSGGVDARELRLIVATGSASATLTCADTGQSVTLSLSGPGTQETYLVGGDFCWVVLDATSANTTAVAWDIPTYLFP